MTVTIAEELLLLAYSDDKGKPLIADSRLDHAVAGALLAELAVRGRVELTGRTLTGRKLTVRDPRPLRDELLDGVLNHMAERSDRSPSWWLQRLEKHDRRMRLLSRLAAMGVLREQRDKALGIFTVTTWPTAFPGVEAAVRQRVSAALAGAHHDERTAALIGLVHSAGLTRKAFPGADRRRFKHFAAGAWASGPVASTVASINSAVKASSSGGAGGDGGDGG
ncbi:GOLPH3/VPS74 family protein [Nonomuraea rubra]|uniref:GOLPH3/VPS74 family protein n=1 Tax=Nonomuraea rubra TaxID=46180 RepID=UPI0033ED56CF